MDNKLSPSADDRDVLPPKKIAAFARALFFMMPLLLATIAGISQASGEKVQMADGMRSNGKIYVVVAVLLTVLAGVFIYLVSLDKKIARLENQAAK